MYMKLAMVVSIGRDWSGLQKASGVRMSSGTVNAWKMTSKASAKNQAGCRKPKKKNRAERNSMVLELSMQ